MPTYPLHSIESAPEASKPVLEAVQKKFGFIPNLFRVMSESPATAKAYATLMDIFETTTNFTAAEKQVILLSASFANGCDYCLAAHSTIATMQGVPAEAVKSAREGGKQFDNGLEALAVLTREVVETRGWPSEEATKAFFAEGYSKAQYLDLLVGVSLKTLSNYVNHATDTPIDDAFKG